MTTKITRRKLLVRGLQIPLGGGLLMGLSGCGGSGSDSGAASATVCADPGAMTAGAQKLRESLGYTETSPTPQQVCAGCAFFHAGGGQCGTCDIFSGGPVNSGGHCDSWSARA